ncbi:hypothetical protein KSP40_PGU005871 [Platanthera guangdongensis]|uniref:Uncharacterized protein n=1 Tax=Platanthera guangdongensis TaxID=2320717 RepID=A0ABR2N122_9ASPA
MVLISLVREYIGRMLQDISGMKVLILDSETVNIVSVAYSQSELLQKEVFLVALVDSMSKESMAHMKTIYFLRPTSENIQNLRHHLANPRFGEYHLFFSNALKASQIQVLADADEHEVVQQVQLWTLQVHKASVIGLLMALLQFSWHLSAHLSFDINELLMSQRGLHKKLQNLCMSKKVDCLISGVQKLLHYLLVIDRRDDPVTPLLTQWTYQEVVLSSEQDTFFKANIYENFGDLGMNIKKMVDDFQQIAKSNQNIQTIDDMAKFVNNYPEYRKMHGNVSKHVTMVTEMSKIVEERKLMLVSQTEQDLACNGGQVAAYEAVNNLLNVESVSDVDCLRLVMLYALRYEKEGPVQLMQLFNKLASRSAKYKSGVT